MAASQTSGGRRRPFGIAILSFLLFLSAVLDLGVVVLGIFAIDTGQFQFGRLHIAAPHLAPADQLSEVLAVAILLPLAILVLLLAIGLWELKPWAYWAVVVVESTTVAIGVISLINHQSEKQTLLTLALPVLILLYLLLDHNVHMAFHR